MGRIAQLVGMPMGHQHMEHHNATGQYHQYIAQHVHHLGCECRTDRSGSGVTDVTCMMDTSCPRYL